MNSHRNTLAFLNRRLILCAIALAFVSGWRLHAGSFEWVAQSGGPWHSSSSWSPAGVPGGQDDVAIGSPSGAVVLEGDAAGGNVFIARAGFRGNGWLTAQKLTLNGSNFAPGVDPLTSPRQVIIGAEGAFSGTISVSRKFVNYGISTNFGTFMAVRPSANQLAVEEAPTWLNESQSQLWLIPGPNSSFADYPIDSSAPQPTVLELSWVTNAANAVLGKILPGPAGIDWHFANFGEVRVNEGELRFSKAVFLNGPMSVANGAILTIYSAGRFQCRLGPNASFTGPGLVQFRYNPPFPYFVEEPLIISSPVNMENVSFEGAGLTFMGPLTFTHRLVGTSPEPFIFLGPTTGSGQLGRNIINFSVTTDDGIMPSNNVTWVNMPFSQFNATGQATGSGLGPATFSNLFGARVDFGVARDRSWNIYNDGLVSGPMVGKSIELRGSLRQSDTGEVQLRNGAFIVRNELTSDGLISGFGTITSGNARISGKISPNGEAGPFGKISFVCEKSPNLKIESSAVFEMDLGAGMNDQIHAQGGTFKGRFDLQARDGFGPGNYLLATYIVTTSGPFQLGAVPPGYRYQLTNNTTLREVRVMVSLPTSPLVTFSGSPGNSSLSLDVSTLPNIPYKIESTDELGSDWQLWTNFVGNGQVQTIPTPSSDPSKFFKITEGSAN